jgi:hypothetical protein
MSSYASSLLKRGGGVVSEDTFAEMVAPQWCPDPRLNHWGLAFARAPHHGRIAFGHGGAYFGGWNSHLDVFPEDAFAVLQHMNVMMDEPSPVFRRIIRAALGVEPRRYDTAPVARDLLEQAPGEYWLTMPGALTNFRPATRLGPVRIERDGDQLTLTSRWGAWKGGVPMHAGDLADPDLFAINREDDDAALLVIERNGDGNVTGLRCDELTYLVKRERAE